MNGDSPTARRTPVVLVHGAWADGSSWGPVIRGCGTKAWTPAPLRCR